MANWLISCGAKLHEDKGGQNYKRSSATLQLCEAAARGNVEHLRVLLETDNKVDANAGDY